MASSKMPDAYKGREQSYLKHRVLEEYLKPWTYKLGFGFGKTRRVKLWFVDCFAGPWKAQAEDRSDTSPAKALGIFKKARAAMQEKQCHVEFGAIFVEASSAYDELAALVRSYEDDVDVHPLRGEFGEHVSRIDALLKDDPAFLFVDPTGWKGAAMKYIQPLAKGPQRDVLVNVMSSFIYRQQKNPNLEARRHLADFYGLSPEEVPDDLDDEGMAAFYRGRLKSTCNLEYGAALAIPKSLTDQTHFQLVVGGHHHKVLEVFRDAEEDVCGEEAAAAIAAARQRSADAKAPGQANMFDLFAATSGYVEPTPPSPYAEMHERDLRRIEPMLRERLTEHGTRFVELWPPVLEQLHVRRSDVSRTIMSMRKTGVVVVDGLGQRETTVKDGCVVRLARAASNSASNR
jgi:three-Cys-motif partner protein